MLMLYIACTCLCVLFGGQSKLLIECYSVTLTFDRVATQSFVRVRNCYYNPLIVNLYIYIQDFPTMAPYNTIVAAGRNGLG